MKKLILAATALSAGFVATPAMAGSATGPLVVNALVLENCTVVALPMVFGGPVGIASVGTADIDTTATLTLACTPNADFDIALDNGANASSGQRRMKSGSNYLPYEIYSNEARSSRWGNTSGSNTVAANANALGVAILTAYGRIAQGTSSVQAGAYSDTVTVTVNF